MTVLTIRGIQLQTAFNSMHEVEQGVYLNYATQEFNTISLLILFIIINNVHHTHMGTRTHKGPEQHITGMKTKYKVKGPGVIWNSG